MGYNWRPHGRFEPFEMHHYVGNYLSDAILTIREGGKPKLNDVRCVISGLLERYADGTYQYRHSDEFNPNVAKRLKERVEATFSHGTTASGLSDLAESLLKAVDKHYVVVDPSKTRKAIKKFKVKMKAERKK